MKMKLGWAFFATALLSLCVACANDAPNVTSGGTGGASDGGCGLSADTAPTGIVTNGCNLLARDTSSCRSSRDSD